MHGDGSVAVAFTRDGHLAGEGRQTTQVPIVDIEETTLEFFALLWAAYTRLGLQGDYRARLTIHPPTEIFRRSDPQLVGHLQQWDGRRVYGWRPLDGPVLTSAGIDGAIDSWVDIVHDVIHQVGAVCRFDAEDLRVTLESD